MSLYGDLPQAKNAAGPASDPAWVNVSKLQPPQRKPVTTLFAPPPSVLRAGKGGRTPLPGRGPGRPTQPQNNNEGDKGLALAAPVVSAHSIFSANGAIEDEYDPLLPNDYDEVMRERERKRKEAEAEAERQAQLREMEKQREEEQRQRERDAESRQVSEEDRRAAALNLSGEEAFLRRAALSRGGGGGAGRGGPPPPRRSAFGDGPGLPVPPGVKREEGFSAGVKKEEEEEDERPGLGAGAGGGSGEGLGAPKGMSLAQRLLEKMGWKEGEGLGKNRQGMSTPLMAQKTDKRSGVIVNAESKAGQTPAEKRPKLALQGKPSRVVCLRNMVGPGDVDDDLEEEVGQECTKYGNVTEVVIFEVTTPGFPVEEAVRIFIQFDRVEAATKALVDLSGRFFGGRLIRCAFFDEERFTAMQLAPAPGEFD